MVKWSRKLFEKEYLTENVNNHWYNKDNSNTHTLSPNTRNYKQIYVVLNIISQLLCKWPLKNINKNHFEAFMANINVFVGPGLNRLWH